MGEGQSKALLLVRLMALAGVATMGLVYWWNKNIPLIKELNIQDVSPFKSLLEKYFTNITLNDLKLLKPKELISFAAYSDRFLMTIFVNKYLANKLDDENKKKEGRNTEMEITKLNMGLTIQKSGRLDLSGKIISSRFDSSFYPDYVPTSKLKEILSDYPFVWDFVKYLDLTHATLFDEDLQHIAHLVREMTSCEIFNLSYNRIFIPKDKDLLGFYELLRLNQVRYVSIVGNVLASIEGKYILNGLPQIELQKLIFIPKCWVERGDWKVFINQENQDLVEQTHEEYYANLTKYSYVI